MNTHTHTQRYIRKRRITIATGGRRGRMNGSRRLGKGTGVQLMPAAAHPPPTSPASAKRASDHL